MKCFDWGELVGKSVPPAVVFYMLDAFINSVLLHIQSFLSTACVLSIFIQFLCWLLEQADT